MTKPKPKPRSAPDAMRAALETEEQKRALPLKPIEIVKVALCAYQSYASGPGGPLGILAESDDRVGLRRGTQASMDRLLFNVNYWRSAYEDCIVAACASKEDAEKLLEAICAWNKHTMKLNTLGDAEIKNIFERFCPPLVENNRRGSGNRDAAGKGKGPVADFALQAKEVAPHLSADKRAALEAVVADVKAEAQSYAHYRDGDTLDALYEILPAWCLQDRIDLVVGNWWNDANVVLYIAETMRNRFRLDGHPEAYCTYFFDMVTEALDGYSKEIGDVPAHLSEKSIEELLQLLADARRSHPDSETEGYGEGFPAWLLYKEQLIWNILVCAIYGPQHARPFMADAQQMLAAEVDAGQDVITNMAKNAYTRYVSIRKENRVGADYSSFDELPEDLHRSSLERIVSFPDMLRTLGYRIVPAASCYPEQRIDELAPSEIEVLSILEHRRWIEERRAAGWSYNKAKDVSKKQSPYLTEWENLPERVREWNRSSARDIPALLAAERLAISR